MDEERRQYFDAIQRIIQMGRIALDECMENLTRILLLDEDEVDDLNRFCCDYSGESGYLISEVQTILRSANESYRSARNLVVDWGLQAERLLTLFAKLFRNYVTDQCDASRDVFLMLIDETTDRMNKVQAELELASTNFSAAVGMLVTLQSRFADEFNTQSSYVRTTLEKFCKESSNSKLPVSVGPFGIVIPRGERSTANCALESRLTEVRNYFGHLQGSVLQTNGVVENGKNQINAEIENIRPNGPQLYINDIPITPMELATMRYSIEGIIAFINNIAEQCRQFQIECARMEKSNNDS